MKTYLVALTIDSFLLLKQVATLESAEALIKKFEDAGTPPTTARYREMTSANDMGKEIKKFRHENINLLVAADNESEALSGHDITSFLNHEVGWDDLKEVYSSTEDTGTDDGLDDLDDTPAYNGDDDTEDSLAYHDGYDEDTIPNDDLSDVGEWTPQTLIRRSKPTIKVIEGFDDVPDDVRFALEEAEFENAI